MIHKWTKLGLALVAVVALGAAMASTASANQPYWITSDGDWTVLSGTQGAIPDEFVTDGGATLCQKTTYSGSLGVTTTTTLSLTPTYSECKTTGIGVTVLIHMNGCHYELHADGQTTTGGAPNGKYDTETTIVCPGSSDITFTEIVTGITKCTTHVEPQNLGTGLVLTKNAAGDLDAHINFSNIKYTQTAGTGIASCATTSTTSNGTWTGSATIQGKNTSGTATTISIS